MQPLAYIALMMLCSGVLVLAAESTKNVIGNLEAQSTRASDTPENIE